MVGPLKANWLIKYTIRTVGGRVIPRKDGVLYDELAENMPRVVKALAEKTADVGDFAYVEVNAYEMGGERKFRYTFHGETGYVSGQ